MATSFDTQKALQEALSVAQALEQVRSAALTIRSAKNNVLAVRSAWLALGTPAATADVAELDARLAKAATLAAAVDVFLA